MGQCRLRAGLRALLALVALLAVGLPIFFAASADASGWVSEDGQPPAITSGDAATFTVGSAGSFTVTSTGDPNATLSESGALPSGVSFHDNGNGTACLKGTPAAGSGGVYSLTITAANGVEPDATQAFTLTVDEAPAITSGNAATFTVGSAGSFTVTSTGYPTPSLSESGALPSGVTFTDNEDGSASLSGTPAAGSAGVYSLTITASNGDDSTVSQAFTLTVNQAPAITSGDAATFTVGSAGSFTVTSTGYPTPSLSESGALPSGVSFHDDGTGSASLSGTPAAGSGGVYSLTITAANAVGSNATQSFTLTVDQAPAITSANHTTFTVGSAGSFTVASTGYPTASLSKSGSLPSGVTFTDDGNGTASLSGTPAASSGGVYSLTIMAANGVRSTVSQVFTLTVDQAPAITSVNHTTFTVGSAGSFTVASSGYPTPSLSESGALPSGVTFTDNGNGTASLSGTPAAGSGGSYALTITAANAVGSNATQSFTLTVDQAPVITSPSLATFVVGTAESFTIVSAGVPAPSVSESGSLPPGVSLHDNGDGTATLAGTPAAGSGGVYRLTITASNGVGPSATQPFTLTLDQAPAINSGDAATFAVGSAGSFTVTSSGVPTSGLSESGALPGGVSFHDNGDGTATLSGTPAAGSGGVYDLTIAAANGVGSGAAQSFALTVNGSPGVQPSAPVVQSSSGVAFAGSVNPEGLPTTAYFEYGIDLSERGPGSSAVLYDQTTPVQQVGSDSNGHPVFSAVSGLQPNALYHVRLVASNSAGTTVGPDQTFTTAASTAPPPPPVLGKAVDVAPVSGHVFILLPPGKSLGPAADAENSNLSKGQVFVPLTEARQIPTGSEIDALNGSLKMVSASGTVGKTQTATLAGGVFKLSQDRRGITKGLTDFTLQEGAFRGGPSYGLCKAKKSADQATIASLSSKTLQLLKVSGHGKFKTTGRYSSATVRGTIWTIADRCDGTLTHVIRDTVLVDDFVRHKTILLHTGQSYLARAIISRK
jgi:large repetitive protein